MVKKSLKTILATGSALVYFLSITAHKVSAAIFNPAVGPTLGGGTPGDVTAAQSGMTFLNYFVLLWRALITVGGLMVIVFFVWGAIEWIVAGGDSGKVQKARDRMTQSAIGLIVLVGSFTIIGLISRLFFGEAFDLLRLTVPTALDAASSTGVTP